MVFKSKRQLAAIRSSKKRYKKLPVLNPSVKKESEPVIEDEIKTNRFPKPETIHEVVVKDQPIDFDDNDDPMDSPAEEVAEHCLFCFELSSADSDDDRDQRRTTIEFVLGITLEQTTGSVATCSNCWRMFELYCSFKTSCLASISKKHEMASIAIKTENQLSDPLTSVSLSQLNPEEINLKVLEDLLTPASPMGSDTRPDSPDNDPSDEWPSEPEQAPPENDESSTTKKKKVIRKVQPTLKLRCPRCPKVFKDRKYFVGHMNKHEGIKPFACRITGCTKAFHGGGLRRHHEVAVHGDHELKKPTVCEICGLTLTTGAYRAHLATHQERRFACVICAKKFTSKKMLVKHQSVHTDERKFECLVCGKRFKSHEANRVHQRIHTQEKPYGCTVCGMRFTYNCLLKAHMEKGHF